MTFESYHDALLKAEERSEERAAEWAKTVNLKQKGEKKMADPARLDQMKRNENAAKTKTERSENMEHKNGNGKGIEVVESAELDKKGTAPVETVKEKPQKKSVEKDKPKMTKKEIKEVKDKAKGTVRADEPLTCTVCGMAILKGQAYKILPADGKNGRRFYHQSSCSPGSPNWMKFRGDKATIKPTSKPVKRERANTEGKKTASKPSNGQPREGTISSRIVLALKNSPKGLTMEQIVKEIKADDTYFTLCRSMIKRNILTKEKNKEGVAVFRAV